MSAHSNEQWQHVTLILNSLQYLRANWILSASSLRSQWLVAQDEDEYHRYKVDNSTEHR